MYKLLDIKRAKKYHVIFSYNLSVLCSFSLQIISFLLKAKKCLYYFTMNT